MAPIRTVGIEPRRTTLPLPVLAYFLAILLPITFNIGPLYMTSVRVVLLLTVVPLLFRLLLGHFGPVLLVDVLFLLHLAWMGVSLILNSPDLVLSQMGSTGVEFIGGYLLGRAYVRDRDSFVRLVKAFGVVLTVLLPFGMIEALTSRALILETLDKLPGIEAVKHIVMEKRMGLYRSQVILPHPILFGLFASTALSLTVVGLYGVIPRARLVVTGVAVLGCVFVSLSSGAILAAVLQFGLIGWFLVFRHTGKPWLLFAAFGALAYVAIDLLSNRTPLDVFVSYATFSSDTAYTRKYILEWGLKNVWANPIFGLGFRDWVRADYLKESVDNFWLLMAMRYGIPGFLAIAGGYAWGLLLVGTHNLGESRELLQLRRAWMIVFAGLAFTLSTVHVWTTAFSFIFFLFGAGMWFITARPEAAEATAAAAAAPATAGPVGPRYRRFPSKPRGTAS